ncbi:MAG TPA: MvaI/BcnI family restriction endonuclease, partial [Leptospiraceae bacterium]|nr:MvaI/BcnI family restriction endonuclease [Leptospiraceae bacterium]
HKYGVRHHQTHLRLCILGIDENTGKIRNSNGKIALMDDDGIETASWSFASMLLHWNRKHNQACYIPSLSSQENNRQYKYGNEVILGIGTDFQLFLKELVSGNIYYDPGIKMENASKSPKIKKRSQFRIKSKYLKNLYKSSENIDVTKHSFSMESN